MRLQCYRHIILVAHVTKGPLILLGVFVDSALAMSLWVMLGLEILTYHG